MAWRFVLIRSSIDVSIPQYIVHILSYRIRHILLILSGGSTNWIPYCPLIDWSFWVYVACACYWVYAGGYDYVRQKQTIASNSDLSYLNPWHMCWNKLCLQIYASCLDIDMYVSKSHIQCLKLIQVRIINLFQALCVYVDAPNDWISRSREIFLIFNFYTFGMDFGI